MHPWLDIRLDKELGRTWLVMPNHSTPTLIVTWERHGHFNELMHLHFPVYLKKVIEIFQFTLGLNYNYNFFYPGKSNYNCYYTENWTFFLLSITVIK